MWGGERERGKRKQGRDGTGITVGKLNKKQVKRYKESSKSISEEKEIVYHPVCVIAAACATYVH